jgi:FKBP-type peptidyl-prolyl cis-trans isomerase
MSKKEILTTVLVLVVLIGGSIGGFLVWNHYDQYKKSQQTQQAAQTTTGTQDIALQQSKTTIGSSSSSNSSSNGAPDPSQFSQYDKYKDAESALFGDIQTGTGTEVKAGTKVGVTYKGWLTNGTLFDQSKPDDTGTVQPLVFTVGEHKVIPGFEQDMVGMKVGGTRLMIIPPKAGYGSTAQNGIPANSVLVFQVHLVDAL